MSASSTNPEENISQFIIFEHFDGGEVIDLDTDLIYDPRDPFAVTMVFRHSTNDVFWTFHRELIEKGLYAPVGEGDVHIWPCLNSSGSAVIVIHLSSPDGAILVEGPSREVVEFVNRMNAVVPSGTERLDFEDELHSVLAQG